MIAASPDVISADTVYRWLEIGALLGGLALVLLRMGKMTGKFEQIGKQQADEISELKKGVQEIGNILIQLTAQSGRMDRIEDRQVLSGRRIDELQIRLNRFVDTQAFKAIGVMNDSGL